MENLRKDYEIEVYPDVGHAFANPTGNNYNSDIATLAWGRTLEFLERHLAE
jgi:carboxymethylenebutenolidase